MGEKTITKVCAREIIDCRGWPTVQVDVWIDDRLMGRADVPSGRSRGGHEAHVLLDGDESRYRGLGVLKAVSNVNDVIRPALKGWHVTEQRKIDMAMKELDGTPNKSHLGANGNFGCIIGCCPRGCECAWSAPVSIYQSYRAYFTSPTYELS